MVARTSSPSVVAAGLAVRRPAYLDAAKDGKVARDVFWGLRRIGERWIGALEMRLLLNTDVTAPLHTLRKDDFLTFSLSRFF